MQTWAAEKDGRGSELRKVCDRKRFSILFKVYDSGDIIKLLELYYLVLVL